MTIYSLDVLLLWSGTSLLFHVQFSLLLPDLRTGFSRGRSGGLVFPKGTQNISSNTRVLIVIITIISWTIASTQLSRYMLHLAFHPSQAQVTPWLIMIPPHAKNYHPFSTGKELRISLKIKGPKKPTLKFQLYEYISSGTTPDTNSILFWIHSEETTQ